MNSFFKLALFSLIGLILASFALGLIGDNRGYYNNSYGGGFGPGMMGSGSKHMGQGNYGPGMQGNFDFEYNNGYRK